jgi:hypothetical protein
MLVWVMPDGPKSVSLLPSTPAGDGVWNAFESYLSALNKIIRQHLVGCIEFEPTRLSMAMIGAFRPVGGRVTQCEETSCLQWQQFVICTSPAVGRRSRADWVRPILTAPVASVRRVKAFFVSQKFNGRNAQQGASTTALRGRQT